MKLLFGFPADNNEQNDILSALNGLDNNNNNINNDGSNTDDPNALDVDVDMDMDHFEVDVADNNDRLFGFMTAKQADGSVDYEDVGENGNQNVPTTNDPEKLKLLWNDPILPMPKVEITNVVCKSNIGTTISVELCLSKLENEGVYQKPKFPALFVPNVKPKATILLFPSGSILITGSDCFADVKLAVENLVKSLKGIGYNNANVHPIRIENIVARVSMGFRIQTDKIEQDPLHSRYCEAQGGNFNCLNYRLYVVQKSPITARIYASGSILFQSAKSVEALFSAIRYIAPLFYQYRLRENDPVEPSTLLEYIENYPQYDEY